MWKFIEKQKKILASETNALAKHWGGKLSVVLVYPNVYSVGMGNLAIHALYKILNDHPNVVCERAFLPDKNDMPLEVLRKLEKLVSEGATIIGTKPSEVPVLQDFKNETGNLRELAAKMWGECNG